MREGGRAMLKHRSGLFFVLFTILMSVALVAFPSISAENEYYAEGDMHWDMPDEHLLVLDGNTGEEAKLTRVRPTA